MYLCPLILWKICYLGDDVRIVFFIHGGVGAGSAGCIDLWDKNEVFFEIFLRYVGQYKYEILSNQGKIPLIVKYKDNTTMECDSDFYTKYCRPIN